MLKKIRKFLLYFTFCFLLIVTAIVILAKVYTQEIKQYAISYLNQYLTTEVHVDNVRLDLLKRFPQATLVFENAHIEDLNNAATGDTMLFAKELLLKFNFIEIFNGQYHINQAEAVDAVLNLSVSAGGKENYLIWHQKESAEIREFHFELNQLNFINTQINYDNKLTSQQYNCSAATISLSGDFTEQLFDLEINSSLLLQSVKIGELTYIKNEKTLIETTLSIDKLTKKYFLEKGVINLGGLNFNVSGNYLAKKSFCDLSITGKDLVLNRVFSVFPSVFFEKFKSYNSKGNLDFSASITGETSKNNVPDIVANFAIKDGKLTESNTQIELDNINFSGHYSNVDLGELSIPEISGSILQSYFSGNIQINNFRQPVIAAKINEEMDLESIQEFFQFQSLSYLNGLLNVDLDIKGESRKGIFTTTKSKGKFHLKNVNIKTNSNDLEYTNLNGLFSLRNGNAIISNCSGTIFNSDFNLAGVLRDFIPYLLGKNEVLTIEADLDSRFIDLSQITALASAANETRGYAPSSILPKNIAFNFNTTVEKLNYKEFDAKNIRGIASLKNQTLKGKNVRFEANEGTYRTQFEFDGSNANNYLFTSSSTINSIDITDLFSEFENFGQDFILARHLSGEATSKLNFACAMDNGFQIKPEAILASMNLTINNGKLVNFETLQDIASYLEKNKLLKPFINIPLMAKKLELVSFSELTNTIEISDQKITIPQMDIVSSFMKIGIKGEHCFNDSIAYGFNFLLRDALMKPAKKDEFGPIDGNEEGYKMFLSMTGTVNDPIFGLDKEEKKLARKKKIENEKQDIKALLKQEIGLFKNDTSIRDYEPPQHQNIKFEIEWDEQDTVVSPVSEEFSSQQREARRNGLKNWLKKVDEKFDSGIKKDSVSVELEEDWQ